MRVIASFGERLTAGLRLAEHLDLVNALERLVTFTPGFRLRGLRLTPRRLQTMPWLGALNYAGRKCPPLGTAAYRYWISEQFDRSASKRMGHCDIFYSWCGYGLHSLREARRRGAAAAIGTGSAHIAFQKRAVEDEYRKLGLRHIATDARMVEKAEREYEEAACLIVPSSFARRTMVEQGVPSGKIRIVREALTRKLGVAPPADRRGKAPGNKAGFRILSVGNVSLRKGLPYLLAAVNRLKLPDAQLLLVGPVSREVLPLLDRYRGGFTVTGPVSDEALAQYYSEASVLVLPSVEDGWGHVVVEAMSCGVPAIVSANVGSADLIQDGASGFVVPACDTEAIMERIERLYRDPVMRAEMGMRAKAAVSRRTWTDYSEEVMGVFRSLLAPPAANSAKLAQSCSYQS
jgi:glycosyltransferase involved in cell wall biosynthesis